MSPRVPIVFGGGLDRETGVLGMRVGGMEDLRNVHLLQDKYQVRRGFELVLTFTDDADNEQTDVLAGIALPGRRDAVYVTYDQVNYQVNIFVGDGSAAWAQWVGEWPFLNPDSEAILTASNPDPPVVMVAEINGVVFFAHAVNAVSARAQTYCLYYEGGYQLEPVTVNWENYEAEVVEQEVRFRGVESHLDYMVGWGWGDAYFDKPELVRISKSGLPLENLKNGTGFDFLHYLNPGDEGDPVIACVSTGETMIAFKEGETWELYGDSYLDFGQRRIDSSFGMEQPRWAISVSGYVFAWTTEGPRLFASDGSSRPLELPLELFLPEQYDLPPKGEDKYAFATYMPIYRSVWFIWGTRCYSCYIRVDGDWKWGYQVLGQEAMCGFRLPQAGYGLVTAPIGYPSLSGTVAGETDVEVTVANHDQDGDETLEIWLKPAGGSWALSHSYPVSGSGTQDETIEDLEAGWYYDVAVRYRRGPYYTAGYESSNPEDWPSGARGFFTTQFSTLPTLDSTVWSRTSASTEQILLTVTPPFTGAGYDVEIRRGGSLVHTETDVSGQFSWADTGCSAEANNVYDCRIVTEYDQGAYTGQVTAWGGPPAPTMISAESNWALRYSLSWANGLSAYTEIYDSLPSEQEADVMDNFRFTKDPGEIDYDSGDIAGSSGLEPWCGVRHKVQAYGVWDYSDISAMQVDGPM